MRSINIKCYTLLTAGPDGVDLSSHLDVFYSILRQVTDTPQEIPFLSILQHLLRIDPKEAVSDVVWDTAETLVHRATLIDSKEETERLLRSPSHGKSLSKLKGEGGRCFCTCHRDESSTTSKRKHSSSTLSPTGGGPPPPPPPPPPPGETQLFIIKNEIIQHPFSDVCQNHGKCTEKSFANRDDSYWPLKSKLWIAIFEIKRLENWKISSMQ